MAYTYTRQSSFTDGDTITAAIFNDEYNQLVNAFAYTTVAGTTGHRHDGSTAQGGSVHTVGDLDFLNKIVADSTNNRWGVFVEVGGAAVEQIRIQDGAIVPVTDNDIDLGTSVLEFKDAYFDGTVTADAFAGPLTGAVTGTASLATAFTVSANNSTDETTYPLFVDGATGTQGAETDTGFTYNPSSGLLTIGGELDAASLDISGSADVDGTMEADAYTVDGTALNEYIADTVGAMVTSNTETNITVTYQDADNTLDFVALGTITALNNATENELVTIGSTTTELDAESGLTYDGSVLTVSGEVDATSLDISGDVDIDGTLETDALSINGTAVTSTAAELNILDGVTSTAAELNILDGVTSTAAELNILDGVTSTAAELNILDGVTASATDINLIDGITNGTAIASKAIITDANIDITGGRNITISGELDAGSLDISGDADIDGTLETDNLTVGGSQGSDGQVLTSTGSGVGWEDAAAGGGGGIDYKSEGTNFTSSLIVGHDTTGTLSNAYGNTAVGIDAMDTITSGSRNTIIGFEAGTAITASPVNVAVGYRALMTQSVYAAWGNTVVGADAMKDNTNGLENAGLGYQILTENTDGIDNAAFGFKALQDNTTGNHNTGVGTRALGNQQTAHYNTAIGSYAGNGGRLTGDSNTMGGYNTMLATTSGTGNATWGRDSLKVNVDGDYNIAIGFQALDANTSANDNVAVGKDALGANTTGTKNTAVGTDALSSNLTGDLNTAIGYNCGTSVTGGVNTLIGGNVGYNITSGGANVVIGRESGCQIGTGGQNTAIGNMAMESGSSGNYNTMIGNHSGRGSGGASGQSSAVLVFFPPVAPKA